MRRGREEPLVEGLLEAKAGSKGSPGEEEERNPSWAAARGSRVETADCALPTGRPASDLEAGVYPNNSREPWKGAESMLNSTATESAPWFRPNEAGSAQQRPSWSWQKHRLLSIGVSCQWLLSLQGSLSLTTRAMPAPVTLLTSSPLPVTQRAADAPSHPSVPDLYQS